MQPMAPARKRPKRMEPPAPHDAGKKRSLLGIKGSEEFATWLDGLATHTRLPLSILVEHALIAYAKQVGYDPTPPER